MRKQGRIHGQYQSRTGGQGRECVFSYFLTRAHQRTNGPTDGRKWDLLEDQKDDMDGAAIPTPYLQQSSNKHMLLAVVKSKK